jgi:hypothetical protein
MAVAVVATMVSGAGELAGGEMGGERRSTAAWLERGGWRLIGDWSGVDGGGRRETTSEKERPDETVAAWRGGSSGKTMSSKLGSSRARKRFIEIESE